MKFKDIFTKYWDEAIIGFIAGLTLYLMTLWKETTSNNIILAIKTFFTILVLITIYSFFVWLGNINKKSEQKSNIKSFLPKNRLLCTLSEIVIILILLTLIIYLINFFEFKFDFKPEVMAILVAILVFYVGWRISRYEHRNNQVSNLKTLMFKTDEIEEMINSYKKTPITFYLLPIIDEAFYFRNLDYEIDCKSTSDLKFYINRIQDKCLIINLMMKELIKSWNKFLESDKIKLESLEDEKIKMIFKQYSKTNKLFIFYHPKILAILNEEDKKGLSHSIREVNCILKERFGIRKNKSI